MPHGIYSGLICTDEKEKKFNPTQHQKDALKAFLSLKHKGMLLYHKLGSGKTCTAIMIADKLLSKKMVKHVYIFSPGSLRQGWVREYCTVCGKDPEIMENDYSFVTYNYAVGNRLPNLDGALVIIDEVHNLVNGYKNGSKNPTKIFNTLFNANCRIIALSGTPIFHYMRDVVVLACLLKNEPKFLDIMDNEIIYEKNEVFYLKKDLDNLFEGIISYFPGSGDEFMPKIIYKKPIKVCMSKAQSIYYWDQNKLEQQLRKIPPNKQEMPPQSYELFKRLYIMACKYIMSRSALNFLYPYKVKHKVYLEDGTGYMKKFYTDTLINQGGWVSDVSLRNGRLLKYSRKFVALFLNIILHIRQKHVIFLFSRKMQESIC